MHIHTYIHIYNIFIYLFIMHVAPYSLLSSLCKKPGTLHHQSYRFQFIISRSVNLKNGRAIYGDRRIHLFFHLEIDWGGHVQMLTSTPGKNKGNDHMLII